MAIIYDVSQMCTLATEPNHIACIHVSIKVVLL